MEIAKLDKKYDSSWLAQSKRTPHNLWAIAAFFDPSRSNQRLDNYRFFRERLVRQGVPLLVVECAFGRQPFRLTTADADILIQVRSQSLLWQKERLLNLALERLPAACRSVAWLDSDVIFVREDWATAAEKLLTDYNVVQLFSEACFLEKGGKLGEHLDKSKERYRRQESFAAYYSRTQKRILDYSTAGGLAWAARREILEKARFYDQAIVGGADWIMINAFLGVSDFNQASRRWSEKVAPLVGGKIGCLKGRVFHLFHGSQESRRYRDRQQILKDREFNPAWDLCLNSFGCWEWAFDVPRGLRRDVRNYFRMRNEEDNSFFSNIYLRVLNLAGGHSPWLYFFNLWPHRFCGWVGSILRRFFPRLYYFLKGQ